MGLGTCLRELGEAWAENAGGTSGALWGAAVSAAGEAVGDKTAPDPVAVSGAVTAAVEAMTSTGKAEVGDKTMMDAAVPFARTLSERVEAGDDLREAWAVAVSVAQKAADGTADLAPAQGSRAHPRPEVSRSPGPGRDVVRRGHVRGLTGGVKWD